MKRIIVRITDMDRVKLRGCEYVDDLTTCKDCVHRSYREGSQYLWCTRFEGSVNPTDYCSWAVRGGV